jgi:predicted alpha/beta-hydrolase family hydrolase
VSQALTAAGIRVVRFAFPTCDSSDGAVRDERLATCIREAASARLVGQHLVLGGLSRGARVSAELVEELGAVALLALAYPFHGRRDPDPRGREQLLAALRVPVLLCQGTRDSLGNRPQVEGYALPRHVSIHWVDEANHALQPRPRSGLTQEDALGAIARASTAFVLGLPQSSAAS